MVNKRPLRPESRSTLKDVAAYAGVSTATVSYVLNGKRLERISQPTQERVMMAARKLHYMPNGAARALVLRQTFTLGVYMSMPPGISIPGLRSWVVRGIMEQSLEHNYAVLVALEGLRLPRTSVDGWISLMAPEPITMPELASRPLIYVSPYFESTLPSLAPSNQEAGIILGQFLIPRSRKAGLILERPMVSSRLCVRRRMKSLERSVEGLIETEHLEPREDEDPDIYLARLLHEKVLPGDFDVLVAESDEMGAKVLRAIQGAGIRVPDQIQVAAFGESGLWNLTSPALTVVDMKGRELGQRAARVLLARVQGESSNGNRDIPLPELIVGETTRG